MSIRFLKCMASAPVAVPWEGKHSSITPEVCPSSPSSSFLQAFTAEHDVMWYRYPFDQFGSAVHDGSPPSLLPTPSIITVRADGRGGKKP